MYVFFFFQAEDGIRDYKVTGVQTCALPISLDEAAADLAGKGIETVVIVPLFLAQGAHLKRELPAMVEKIRKRHAKTEFRVTPALGESPEIVAAITEWVLRAAR